MGEAFSPQKRTWNFLTFIYFCGLFLPSRIRNTASDCSKCSWSRTFLYWSGSWDPLSEIWIFGQQNSLSFVKFFARQLFKTSSLQYRYIFPIIVCVSSVLRIRDVYPGCLSRIRIFSFRFPDQGSKIFPHLHKEFKFFDPNNLFLSPRKYDPRCSSRIRTLIFYPSRIQGSKRHRIRIRKTGFHSGCDESWKKLKRNFILFFGMKIEEY